MINMSSHSLCLYLAVLFFAVISVAEEPKPEVKGFFYHLTFEKSDKTSHEMIWRSVDPVSPKPDYYGLAEHTPFLLSRPPFLGHLVSDPTKFHAEAVEFFRMAQVDIIAKDEIPTIRLYDAEKYIFLKGEVVKGSQFVKIPANGVSLEELSVLCGGFTDFVGPSPSAYRLKWGIEKLKKDGIDIDNITVTDKIYPGDLVLVRTWAGSWPLEIGIKRNWLDKN